jgi:hypothetical protein
MRKLCVMSMLGLVFSALFSTASLAALKIEVSSTPPLPAENFIPNSNFENNMQSWTMLGKPEDMASEGWKVEPASNAYQGKKNALYIKVERKANSRTRGAYQSLSPLFIAGKLVPGKSYVLSCRVNAGKSVKGGGNLGGAGVILSVASADWKQMATIYARTDSTNDKWIKLVSQPLKWPEWGVAGMVVPSISYTEGEAYISDICLSEAYVDLSVKVRGGVISQVLVADETGKTVFDSGSLPGGTKDFSKSISVLSVYKYKVTALDNEGNICEQEYPAGSSK